MLESLKKLIRLILFRSTDISHWFTHWSLLIFYGIFIKLGDIFMAWQNVFVIAKQDQGLGHRVSEPMVTGSLWFPGHWVTKFVPVPCLFPTILPPLVTPSLLELFARNTQLTRDRILWIEHQVSFETEPPSHNIFDGYTHRCTILDRCTHPAVRWIDADWDAILEGIFDAEPVVDNLPQTSLTRFGQLNDQRKHGHGR